MLNRLSIIASEIYQRIKNLVCYLLKDPLLYWSLFLVLCVFFDLWSGFFGFKSVVGHRLRLLYTMTLYSVGCFSIVYLLGRRYWLLFSSVIIFSLIFSGGQLISLYYYKLPLSGDMLMMILASSPQEMNIFVKELFFKPLFITSIVLYAILILIIWFLIKWTRGRLTDSTYSLSFFIRGTALFFLCLFCSVLIFSNYQFIQISQFNFLKQIYSKFEEYKRLVQFVKSDNVIKSRISYNEAEPPIICIVIGESATRDAWSLYGYERTTTPFIDSIKHELLVFDARASALHTTVAMKYFLTDASPEKTNEMKYCLPKILKSSGYKTVLLSNQSHWGQFDGPITMLFSPCSEKFYIRHDSQTKGIKQKKTYDNDLLPYFFQYLQSGQNEPLVIFMHLAGSHFPWRDAVPQEKQVYKQAELAINETKETLRNSYDNSILFTDSILKEIIENLKNSNRTACLFYFSDHGDSPSSGRERDVTSNEIWNIPAIIWGNKFFWRDYPDVKEYLSEKQNKNIRADHFFDIVLKLAGVEIIKQ